MVQSYDLRASYNESKEEFIKAIPEAFVAMSKEPKGAKILEKSAMIASAWV